MAVLQGPSLKQADLIAQELGEAPGDIERGVRDLRSMLAASPYLPDPENLGESHWSSLFSFWSLKKYVRKNVFKIRGEGIFFNN